MKEKNIAAVLAFFAGGLGGHHFYLGNSGRGALYFVLCLTFIPSLIAFVEGVQFLLMSDDDFNLKYNQNFLERPSESERFENLERIANLKEKGILSEEEYQYEKSKLVS